MSRLMNGFPAADASQVTLANWRTAPFNSWSFHHVRELVPSADIPADRSRAGSLTADPVDLGGLEFDDGAGGGLSFDAFLEHSHTDGMVILRNGKITFEYYANGMTTSTPHILMSVSKSMLGLLAGALVARGDLDPELEVSELIPEIAETAYKDATIRHLLDMRTGLDFDEDYLATSGPIIAYRKSTNWNPLEPGEAASDLRSFYRELQDQSGPHGGPVNYVSPNCDLLGWVMERATGRRYADLMSELVWQPLGAENDAYITVDRLGAPRCAGGMCVTTRDLARVGQLIVDDGTRNSCNIIPPAWINDIERSGDEAAWQSGNMECDFPGLDILYRSQCYSLRGDTPLLFGFGIHGQYLFADRNNGIVIAKFSSQPIPIDVDQIMLTMRAVPKIVNFLK
jgi:CubicO group peptidase (beta-lactamase class C family)